VEIVEHIGAMIPRVLSDQGTNKYIDMLSFVPGLEILISPTFSLSRYLDITKLGRISVQNDFPVGYNNL
jgi:hypothetical protein